MSEINKYFAWTNEQLKEELVKRGLRSTGKKKDLQERLIFCDKNEDFYSSRHQGPDATFWTPSESEYRDINGMSKIPFVSKNQIELFLERYNVNKSLGREMYENEYLLYARIAEVNKVLFLRGHCLAQMKKSVQYRSDIKMSNDGFIEGSHCECAVGSGKAESKK